MFGRVRAKIRKYFELDEFLHIQHSVIQLNDIEELKKIFRWQKDPIINDRSVYDFDYIEDVNQRRIRDAQSLGTVVCNTGPKVCLEIGTSTGHSTALIAENAPQAHVFTVNIPPEELNAGKGGDLTTVALEQDQIGIYYRERKLKNITQIFANTASWEPNIGIIDVAFIDGCHDTEFVYNDTRNILKYMKPGAFILWHDFNPHLMNTYNWIRSVCMGIEKLYRAGFIRGRIFHVRDSWIGIYKLEDKTDNE